MFIHFRGYGFVVPLVAIPVLVVCMSFFGEEFTNTYSIPVGLIISGVICYWIGARLLYNRKKPEHLKPKLEVLDEYHHDLYFIPVRYWGIILIISGVLFRLWEYVNK